jgi:hypothetical protein
LEEGSRRARAVKPPGLITEAYARHMGITDVICLMGFYRSMTLAFYDVPAGARDWPAERPPSEQGRKLFRRRKQSRRSAIIPCRSNR